jgi:transposase
MQRFYLGVDTSKGYADFCFSDPAGTTLPGTQRYDDTPAGHAAVRQRCRALLQQHPDAELLVGLEASGGLERNWLRCFRELVPPDRGRVYQLNPLAVKRYLERDLHRNITDALSARGIAAYLREGLRPADRPFEPQLEGPLALYRFTANTVERCAQLQNELQSLLPCVQPDLVAYCREELPNWVLRLLVRYPTAAALSRARPKTVAQIPYITPARATRLVQAAQTSVAAVGDPHSATVVQSLAREILRLNTQIDTLKRRLVRELQHDPEVRLCISIPGIGPWTAVVLRLEYGTLTRFHNADAVVAFAGLDPRRQQSGDTEREAHISRRGRKEIRAALYMPALTATRDNPVIREFYLRLRSEGKEHQVALVACMAKLLRLAYACVLSGQPFAPDHHRQSQARHHERPRPASAPAPAAPGAGEAPASATPVVGALSAPVSRREARRRRAAAMPQVGVPQRKRGRGAALTDHDSCATCGCQSSSIPLSKTP